MALITVKVEDGALKGAATCHWTSTDRRLRGSLAKQATTTGAMHTKVVPSGCTENKKQIPPPQAAENCVPRVGMTIVRVEAGKMAWIETKSAREGLQSGARLRML